MQDARLLHPAIEPKLTSRFIFADPLAIWKVLINRFDRAETRRPFCVCIAAPLYGCSWFTSRELIRHCVIFFAFAFRKFVFEFRRAIEGFLYEILFFAPYIIL